VQIGSGESFTPPPTGSKAGPLASATPVIEDPSAQRARGLSSREAVIKEVERIKDKADTDKKDEENDPTKLSKNGLRKR
jgi:hypothetical protein